MEVEDRVFVHWVENGEKILLWDGEIDTYNDALAAGCVALHERGITHSSFDMFFQVEGRLVPIGNLCRWRWPDDPSRDLVLRAADQGSDGGPSSDSLGPEDSRQPTEEDRSFRLSNSLEAIGVEAIGVNDVAEHVRQVAPANNDNDNNVQYERDDTGEAEEIDDDALLQCMKDQFIQGMERKLKKPQSWKTVAELYNVKQNQKIDWKRLKNRGKLITNGGHKKQEEWDAFRVSRGFKVNREDPSAPKRGKAKKRTRVVAEGVEPQMLPQNGLRQLVLEDLDEAFAEAVREAGLEREIPRLREQCIYNFRRLELLSEDDLCDAKVGFSSAVAKMLCKLASATKKARSESAQHGAKEKEEEWKGLLLSVVVAEEDEENRLLGGEVVAICLDRERGVVAARAAGKHRAVLTWAVVVEQMDAYRRGVPKEKELKTKEWLLKLNTQAEDKRQVVKVQFAGEAVVRVEQSVRRGERIMRGPYVVGIAQQDADEEGMVVANAYMSARDGRLLRIKDLILLLSRSRLNQ